MRPTEQLAILTALKKAIDQRIKDVRQVADEELLDAYDDIGVEKLALKVDKQKVGNLIITFSKEGYVIEDQDKLEEFALDYGLADIYTTIDPDKYDEAVSLIASMAPELLTRKTVLCDDWDKAVYFADGECVFQDSGMIIPGIKYQPSKIKNTMVRGCNPEDVLPVVKRLGGVDQLLLEGE